MDQIVIVISLLTLSGQIAQEMITPFDGANLEDCRKLAKEQERAANALAKERNRHYRVRHTCKKT
jgi:hypothetical protein